MDLERAAKLYFDRFLWSGNLPWVRIPQPVIRLLTLPAIFNRLLEDADDEALAIIRTQREQTKILAEALLERETLTRDEVIAVLKLSATKSGKIDYARN